MTARRTSNSGKCKKASTKASTKTNGKPENRTKKVGGKTPDPYSVRDAMVGKILRSGKEIIDSVVDEAKKGNYLPAKYLFEFAGITKPLPEVDAEAEKRARSLAEILLGAVQNPEEETSSG